VRSTSCSRRVPPPTNGRKRKRGDIAPHPVALLGIDFVLREETLRSPRAGRDGPRSSCTPRCRRPGSAGGDVERAAEGPPSIKSVMIHPGGRCRRRPKSSRRERLRFFNPSRTRARCEQADVLVFAVGRFSESANARRLGMHGRRLWNGSRNGGGSGDGRGAVADADAFGGGAFCVL